MPVGGVGVHRIILVVDLAVVKEVVVREVEMLIVRRRGVV
jgi:hypothetical protein